MIQIIGLMIGFYIIAKMCELIEDCKEKKRPITGTVAFAVAMINIIGIIALISTSTP